MKLKKRIAAIGAAVMMATSVITASAKYTTTGNSIIIDNCRTSSYFHVWGSTSARQIIGDPIGGTINMYKNQVMKLIGLKSYNPQFVYLKTISYKGEKVGEIYGKFEYNAYSADYVRTRTMSSKYKHYAWVDTDADFKRTDYTNSGITSTTGKCELSGWNGDKGTAEFGGVLRIS